MRPPHDAVYSNPSRIKIRRMRLVSLKLLSFIVPPSSRACCIKESTTPFRNVY